MWFFGPPAPVKPAPPSELQRLRDALIENGISGAAIEMDPKDTSFVRGIDKDEYDRETMDAVNAIASIPTHY